MSADNYYVIVPNEGKWSAIMYFMSDNEELSNEAALEEQRRKLAGAEKFDTPELAYDSVKDEVCEYGIFLDDAAKSFCVAYDRAFYYALGWCDARGFDMNSRGFAAETGNADGIAKKFALDYTGAPVQGAIPLRAAWLLFARDEGVL